MKKHVTFLLVISFFSLLTAGAQDFDSYLQKISEQLNTVQSGKREYQQSIESSEPGVVSIHIDEVDSKGRTKSNVYHFNLADIDPNTVRSAAKGDIFTVNLSVEKKQKLIRKTLNDEKQSYIYSLTLYATDPDNGRAMAETLKKVIPVARKILDKRLSLNGYSDRMDWLKEHIGNVDLVKKQISQEWSENPDYPGAVVFHSLTSSGKSEIDMTYAFNLAHLNPKQINFFVNGSAFGLKVSTLHSGKLIKVTSNGQQKSYTDKMNIATNNVEEARDIQKVLIDIIPLAKQKLEAFLPEISGLQNGMDIINGLIEKTPVNEQEYEQKISGDCVVTFEQNINGAKKSYSDVYEFNLADLNKNQIKILTKGKVIVVELKTKSNQRYIKYSRDGEVKSYNSSCTIYVPGPEQAIIVQKALRDMTGICQEKFDPKKQSPLNFNAAVQLLKDNLKNFSLGENSYEHTVEFTDDNKSLKYQNIVTGKKSSKELLYEVNLSDLNPKSVKMKVNGKKIDVEISTNHMEKLIKYYKDGKIQTYQTKISIPAPDIETARKIKRALKNLTKK